MLSSVAEERAALFFFPWCNEIRTSKTQKAIASVALYNVAKKKKEISPKHMHTLHMHWLHPGVKPISIANLQSSKEERPTHGLGATVEQKKEHSQVQRFVLLKHRQQRPGKTIIGAALSVMFRLQAGHTRLNYKLTLVLSRENEPPSGRCVPRPVAPFSIKRNF